MKNLFKQYIPYLIGYKYQFFLSLLGMSAVAIGTAGTAQLIKPVLDDVFVAKDTTMLAIIPFMLIGVFLLKAVGKYVQTYYMSYIGLDVIRKLRNDLVKHLTYQDISFFQTMHTGEILSRITNDIGRIQSVITLYIPTLIRESLTIIALTGYVIYQSPKLAFYFLIIMPLAIYPLSRLAKKMKLYSRQSQESTSDMTSRLGEIFSNIEIIKASSSQKLEAQKFSEENYNVFKFLLKQVKVNALSSPIMELLGAIAIGLVIYIGGKEVIEEQMTVGEFFSFATALFMLYSPIKGLSSHYNQAQDAIVANNRMHELLNHKPTINSGDIELKEQIKHIGVLNASLEYGDKKALNRISLGVDRGETIALVGDSGAGKSSLVNLLVRFYDPSEGEIIINDKYNLKDLTLESLHQRVAYVTQRIYIFNDTIAQNIAYGQEFNKERVMEALKKAYALEFIENLDNGIDTILSENGNNLSGGQRQRIALARAIYRKPDLLILDEATSALDNKSEALIQKALEALKDEMITITVAHRLSTIEKADAILVFREGEIICRGQHEDLINECIEYQKLAKKL